MSPQEMFLITADVSDGIPGQDRSSASVWDVAAWEQVAHWHGYCDPAAFGYILRDIGVFYNWATIAVETNYPGNATHSKLVELEYPKLWINVETGKPWKTDAKFRPLAISALREAVRESTIKINSKATLAEMKTFVRKDNGKLEGESGSHDDCVMDAAIAAYILKTTAFTPEALDIIRRKPLREILRVTDHRYRPGSKPGVV